MNRKEEKSLFIVIDMIGGPSITTFPYKKIKLVSCVRRHSPSAPGKLRCCDRWESRFWYMKIGALRTLDQGCTTQFGRAIGR